jgi:L-threonylcarbamoyladenylate synthase
VSDAVEDAVEAALAGRLIVLPTDTVYGVGTRPDDPAATARVFAAKGRPRDLELPILVASPAAAEGVAAFDEPARALAARFWPGPLTIVLPRTSRSRPWDLGGDADTVGVRVPRHPLAIAVLVRTGPLAVTSANRSGSAPATTCDEIVRILGDVVDVMLCEDRPLEGVSSTVVDLAHGEPRILREGELGEAVLRLLAPGGAREPPV